MIKPSGEQRDIIEADLVPLSVIACAGSGKTLTAVRRLVRIRKEMGEDRGCATLLSFSNAAVDAFRDAYAQLQSLDPPARGRSGVVISTIDSFITSNVLLPHAYRTMNASVAAYLVTGNEPFLKSFTIKVGTYPKQVTELQARLSGGQPYFIHDYFGNETPVDTPTALKLVSRLGRHGAYTYELGRYWCFRTLQEQPAVLRALSRRHPHIIVDEAQDISTIHQAILEMLAAAGTTISLIGDPNQAIFGFADADGMYLRRYATFGSGRKSYPLTRNFRSIPSILAIANALSLRTDSCDRATAAAPAGGHFIPYGSGQEQQLIDTFNREIAAVGLSPAKSAVLFRQHDKAEAFAGAGDAGGQGATKRFAQAALFRDARDDSYAAFESVVRAMVQLLSNTPHDLAAKILRSASSPETRAMRRDLWKFTRSPYIGLPSASLPAYEWHEHLIARVKALLTTLEASYGFKPVDNLGRVISRKKLPSGPLVAEPELLSAETARARVTTVHKVKGESLDAVLYVGTKQHVGALVGGVGTENGRIGYVAVTRARDLFWLGVPSNCLEEFRPQLVALGFSEVGDASALTATPEATALPH